MEKLLEDMKQAMRTKDSLRLSVLRMIKGEVDKIRIDKKCEITEDILMDVFMKQLKMREESLLQFEKAGRSDLVTKTKAEIEVIQSYLPEPLEEEAVLAMVDEIFQEVKPEGIRDMGKIMALLTPKIKGRYDLSKASQIVRARL